MGQVGWDNNGTGQGGTGMGRTGRGSASRGRQAAAENRNRGGTDTCGHQRAPRAQPGGDLGGVMRIMVSSLGGANRGNGVLVGGEK